MMTKRTRVYFSAILLTSTLASIPSHANRWGELLDAARNSDLAVKGVRESNAELEALRNRLGDILVEYGFVLRSGLTASPINWSSRISARRILGDDAESIVMFRTLVTESSNLERAGFGNPLDVILTPEFVTRQLSNGQPFVDHRLLTDAINRLPDSEVQTVINRGIFLLENTTRYDARGAFDIGPVLGVHLGRVFEDNFEAIESLLRSRRHSDSTFGAIIFPATMIEFSRITDISKAIEVWALGARHINTGIANSCIERIDDLVRYHKDSESLETLITALDGLDDDIARLVQESLDRVL